jgi:hypothetical protein
MNEEMGFGKKRIEERDVWPVWPWLTRKKWLLIGCILIAIPVFITPFGFPVPVESSTRDYYDFVESGGTNQWVSVDLPDEPVIFMGSSFAFFDVYDQSRDFFHAMLNHLAMNDYKLLMFSYGTPCAAIWEKMVSASGIEAKYGYVYGEDFVIFPYMAGDEIAMSLIADIKGNYALDNRGNPTGTIPLLQNINSGDDADVFWSEYHIFTYGEMFIRQWPAAYDKPLLNQGAWHGISPWYGTYCVGSISGEAASLAWLEQQVNMPGEELFKVEAANLVGLFGLAMIVIGLIHSFIKGEAQFDTFAPVGGARKI